MSRHFAEQAQSREPSLSIQLKENFLAKADFAGERGGMFTRRQFLGRSLLAAGAGLPVWSHAAGNADTKPDRPKRILFLVSDGMSMGMLGCSDLVSRARTGESLVWSKLLSAPGAANALMRTRSLNALVTDSAAAASAWGSGSRVANGALNMLPDGRALRPLYGLLAEKGWATGLVSTAEITHATPAGFAIVAESRQSGDEIAAQYLDKKIDVLLGGGSQFFSPKSRKDGRDLFWDFEKAGYVVVQNRTELEGAANKARLLGTFAAGHLPYTVDEANLEPKDRVPTLADLTTVALGRLENHENFILQIEAARVDHAAHNSDAAAGIGDQIAFDEAIKVCLDFQNRHPDTLVIVTTDHGNSNPGLNGMASLMGEKSFGEALAGIRASVPEILNRIYAGGEKFSTALGDRYNVEPDHVRAVLREWAGFDAGKREAKIFAEGLAGEFPVLYGQMQIPATQLGQILANRVGIGWTGNTHTADFALFTAVGPGAESFGGLMENTDLFPKILNFAGVDYRNPSLPLAAKVWGPSAENAENPTFAV